MLTALLSLLSYRATPALLGMTLPTADWDPHQLASEKMPHEYHFIEAIPHTSHSLRLQGDHLHTASSSAARVAETLPSVGLFTVSSQIAVLCCAHLAQDLEGSRFPIFLGEGVGSRPLLHLDILPATSL